MSDKIEFEGKVVWVSGNLVTFGVADADDSPGEVQSGTSYRVALEPIEPGLKPCPFCGNSGHPIVMIVNNLNSGRFYARCMECWVTTREYDTEAEAADIWNRRAS